ncbi:MAG: AraC family transcriptional regulator [Gammaproteobacteria bacterium]
MDDLLVALLRRFELTAEGLLCGPLRRPARHNAVAVYVHLVRTGRVALRGPGRYRRRVDGPCVVLLPRGGPHMLEATDAAPAIVSIALDFGLRVRNPLTVAVPALVVVPLALDDSLGVATELLYREGIEQHCGRQAVIDRLGEVVLVLLLRHLMDTGQVRTGVLAGLADARLMKALNAMHEDPAEDWSLARLAAVAGMSRARFASHFRATVGQTPGAYLTDWRLSLAQSLLRAGQPVNVVADAVGYEAASAFARVFSQRIGLAPTAWLRQQRA